MLSELFQAVIFAALALYIYLFARKTLRKTNEVRRRWFRWLPDRPWSLNLLRGMAYFWTFGAFLMFLQAIALALELERYRGERMLLVGLAAAVGGTALVAFTTRKHS